MKTRKIVFGACALLFSGVLFAQAAPVVAVDDPESLFVDDDPVIHRNKQSALHIMRELLQCRQWNRADEWLTERYIQHNPSFASGRATVVNAFSGVPAIEPCGKLTTGIVAVTADDEHVSVIIRRELDDPRNPGQKYTTIWVDMWRFVDGKADEHWDTAVINAGPAR
ncbi:MAG: nuclear transport factor 2 family protein [Gammaproteobacteria bacterium]|nr:nuclear transport factor 2 family protein [Gammaproteobacteria bacterium]